MNTRGMAEANSIAFCDFDKRETMTSAEVADVFNKVANSYDETWQARNYRDHIYVAEGVADFFPERRADVRILNVGAGTGLLATQLWKKDFRQIDGLDPSTGMKTEAMKKHVYTNYYLEFMDGHVIDNLDTDSYSCLVVAAAFNTGFLPCVSVLEMVRLVKPGGLICFGVPDSRFTEVKEYIDRLAPLMLWMEQDGLWQLLDKKHYDDFYDNANPGDVFRYVVHASDVDVEKYIDRLCNSHLGR